MIDEFLSTLKVKLACGHANDGIGQWEYLEPFSFRSNRAKTLFTIPLGFSVDFASVPRLPLMYAMFGGRYARSAGAHDYLCRTRLVSREKADSIFLDLMRLENEEELTHMSESSEDEEVIESRRTALEGRCCAMYAAVSFYTRTGFWKTEVDQPGFEPIG